MAANLTPQYLEAEADFKKAQTAEERLECLKRMFTLLPKHKASEKMQADLKTRMSDLRKEVEQETKNPKKVSVSYKIPKQGAGPICPARRRQRRQEPLAEPADAGHAGSRRLSIHHA